MKIVMKLIGGWCVAGILSLYLAFVFQMLWNWFVSPALHVDISYWNAVGLLMVTNLVKLRNSDVEVTMAVLQIKRMVEASIPEEKRAETMRIIEESNLLKKGSYLMVDSIKATGGTVLLGIGFGIHALLM